MSIKQLLSASLFKFEQLKDTRKLSFWKIILYLLFLSSLSAIPITYQVSQIFQDIHHDSQKIAEKIPDFTIRDGVLTPEKETEGFIYQTNSIIMTFDPEGKRTSEDINTDLIGNFFSIGLLKNELVISLPQSGASNALLGDNQIELAYTDSNLKNLNGSHIRNYLEKNQIPWWLQGITFIISIYPSFLNLIITLLIAALGASILAKFRRLRLSYFENLKIIVFSATIPVMISMIIRLFNTNFDTSTFIIIASIFIYLQAIKNIPAKN